MPSILIVEDNASNMKLASPLLEGEGYQILQAGDAEAGIRLARETVVVAARPALLDHLTGRVEAPDAREPGALEPAAQLRDLCIEICHGHEHAPGCRFGLRRRAGGHLWGGHGAAVVTRDQVVTGSFVRSNS